MYLFQNLHIIKLLASLFLERMRHMSAVQATKAYQDNIDEAVNVLVSKLDEAIDDLENGRVLTEEEMWAELDEV